MDLISRQAAIAEANAWLLDCFNVQKQDRSCGLIRRLEDLPSAQPEIVKTILEAGYTGQEVRFRIDGRLFAVRELAQ